MKEKSDMGLAGYFFGMAHGIMVGFMLALVAIDSDFVKIDTEKMHNKNSENIPHKQTILSSPKQEGLAFNHPASLSPESPHIQ